MNRLARLPVIVTVLTLLCGAGSAHAASITLYNTGIDGGGGIDANYSLTSAPGGATGAYLLTTIPSPPWYSSTGTWIGVNNANACYGTVGCDNDPVGFYEFDLLFDLTGLNPSTATISGSWSTDNGGKILLNGVEVASQPSNAYSTLENFTISSNFIAGVNTLRFIVNNDDCGGPSGGCPDGQGGSLGNPVGLLVTNMRGEAAVPEPAVLALLGGGLLAVGRRYRRRRNAA